VAAGQAHEELLDSYEAERYPVAWAFLPWVVSNSIDLCTIPKADRCICAVRDTEPVLQCQVLRCQERATRNFVIDQGKLGFFETIVCEMHAAALKAGERYVYNSVENVIYMGQDAPRAE
jgi:hypothetical protein